MGLRAWLKRFRRGFPEKIDDAFSELFAKVAFKPILYYQTGYNLEFIYIKQSDDLRLRFTSDRGYWEIEAGPVIDKIDVPYRPQKPAEYLRITQSTTLLGDSPEECWFPADKLINMITGGEYKLYTTQEIAKFLADNYKEIAELVNERNIVQTRLKARKLSADRGACWRSKPLKPDE